MAGFNDWSTTAASNNSVGSINWSENQAANTVNNSARQEMADVAAVRDGSTIATGWHVEDDGFRLYHTADTTRVAKFDVSRVSAGGLNEYTLPSAGGVLALTSDITGGNFQSVSGVLTDIAGTTFLKGDIIYAGSAGSLTRLGGNGSAAKYLKSQGNSAGPTWALPTLSAARYSYSVASGNTGPTFTGSQWNAVVLNTEDFDANSIGALSAGEVNLAAGTYLVMADATFTGNSTHCRSRLYDYTAAAVVLQGINDQGSSTGGTNGHASLVGLFTISTTSALELQVYASTNTSAAAAVSSGESEIFAYLQFVKIA